MNNSDVNVQQNNEIKVTKMVNLIIASFLLCWMPITICFLAVVVTNDRDYVPDDIVNASILLAHLHCVLDPVVYAFFVKEFRNGITSLFRCPKLEVAARVKTIQKRMLRKTLSNLKF